MTLNEKHAAIVAARVALATAESDLTNPASGDVLLDGESFADLVSLEAYSNLGGKLVKTRLRASNLPTPPPAAG